MDLTYRIIEEGDYTEILSKWWIDWGFLPIPEDFLSETGIIIYDGDIPVCAGFAYSTNSYVALVNWIISNKEYRVKPNRKKALDLLVEKLTYICEDAGFKYIFVNNNNPQLISRFKNHGYMVGTDNSTELIKKI